MAIFNRPDYIQNIQGLLPDNSTQEISPLDLRTALIDAVDSVHLFIADKQISSLNFSSPDTRTTIAGEGAINKITYAGRTSVDNTAVGYYSIGNLYTASGNTAVGSYSQGCNIYGVSNTSVGHLSMAGLTNGHGNVGIGNYALNNNRTGSWNIALGHAAGWWLGPDSDYKLVIGSFSSQLESFCDENGDNIYSTSQQPLIYGDLDPSNHRVAIATKELHDYGTLQVSGDVSPTQSGVSWLGKSQRPWAGINDQIYFSGKYVGVGGQPSGAAQGLVGSAGSDDGKLTVYGDIFPSQSGRFSLGHPSLTWDGYFNDVLISGQLLANDIEYNTITNCLYECKTLHLATSGFCDPEDLGFHNSAVCGFLTDASLDGAGIEVHSSGGAPGDIDYYRRDYKFIYRAPDPSIYCFDRPEYDNPFTRSRWESNISMELGSGLQFITERVIGRKRSEHMIQSGCFGMFLSPVSLSGQKATFGPEAIAEGSYSGIQDVNFLARSGTDIINGSPSGYNYGVTLGSIDSGVKIIQSFLTRIQDESVRGFRIIYHDERDSNGEIPCEELGYPNLDIGRNMKLEPQDLSPSP